MRDGDIAAISTWLVERGLGGASEAELVTGFCRRCTHAGLVLSRGLVLVDTLHPIYEGRAFHWQDDGDGTVENPYGRTDTGEAAEDWLRSVWYHIVETGCGEIRRHFGRGDPASSGASSRCATRATSIISRS